jgi:8-oxo-dGTP pyrophosphatase MutT (NUDIX family)
MSKTHSVPEPRQPTSAPPNLLTLSSAKTALRAHAPEPIEGQSYAAVAVLLCEHPTEESVRSPHVLLIQRAIHPADPWSGHLAFPGGRKDLTDTDLLHTAVRETWEEIGVHLDPQRQLLGKLDPLTARGARLPGLVIEPFVFEVPHRDVFAIDTTEVAQAFWVPIGPLTRGERNTSVDIQRDGSRYKLPGYQVGQQVLWGMTYEMFQRLARLSQWLP